MSNMALSQSPTEIFMMKPANFLFNEETSVTNHFQSSESSGKSWRLEAEDEFLAAVQTLRDNKVRVKCFQDTDLPVKPDAIFPNNWISCHQTGEVVLYPMATPNRRLERRPDVVSWLRQQFLVRSVLDLSHYEQEGKFLEGTGSMVLDYQGGKCYACLSVRTHPEVLTEFCRHLNLTPVLMNATDSQGRPIYHTNVFMAITRNLVVICMDAVREDEKSRIESELKTPRRKIIEISQSQVENFAGNCYEVEGQDGRDKFIISARGWASLRPDQKRDIAEVTDVVVCNVNTIERVGGGGIRCMMTGIFLPKK